MPIQQQDTIGDLTKLLGLVKGPSNTSTTSSNISKEGMQGLINQILGGSQGLATVSQGQKAAGLYGSTTNQMLTNDLITRSAQQLGVAQAGTTTKQKAAAPISGQNLLQMLTMIAGQKVLGPTIKKGIAKTGLEGIGDKIAGAIFPDGAGTGIGSSGTIGMSAGDLESSLSAFGGSLTTGDVAATATGLDLGSIANLGGSSLAGLEGLGSGITAASVLPEATAALSSYGAGLTAADVGATALGLDIAGMTATATTGAEIAATTAAATTAAEVAATAAGAAEGASILTTIGTAIAEAVPFLASLFSDERLKTDIKPVGETKEGQTIYTYKFKGDPFKTHMGVMAQETLKTHPEAVIKHPSGALMVDYDKILGVD